MYIIINFCLPRSRKFAVTRCRWRQSRHTRRRTAEERHTGSSAQRTLLDRWLASDSRWQSSEFVLASFSAFFFGSDDSAFPINCLHDEAIW